MNQQPPAPTASPCICRCCGGAMEALYQPSLMPGRTGYWLLTCRNNCPLNNQTFVSTTYATIDLTPYLKKLEPSTPAELPCTCRICGGTLEAKQQKTGIPDKPAYWMVTCWNPACGLNGYTRSASTYDTFDLTPYLEKEQSS